MNWRDEITEWLETSGYSAGGVARACGVSDGTFSALRNPERVRWGWGAAKTATLVYHVAHCMGKPTAWAAAVLTDLTLHQAPERVRRLAVEAVLNDGT